MGGGSGGQAAMTVVWVAAAVTAAVLAFGGFMVFAWARRRPTRRSPAEKREGSWR